jgi:hypothetical protein
MGSTSPCQRARDVIESSCVRDSFGGQKIDADPFPQARIWFEFGGNPQILIIRSFVKPDSVASPSYCIALTNVHRSLTNDRFACQTVVLFVRNDRSHFSKHSCPSNYTFLQGPFWTFLPAPGFRSGCSGFLSSSGQRPFIEWNSKRSFHRPDSLSQSGNDLRDQLTTF